MVVWAHKQPQARRNTYTIKSNATPTSSVQTSIHNAQLDSTHASTEAACRSSHMEAEKIMDALLCWIGLATTVGIPILSSKLFVEYHRETCPASLWLRYSLISTSRREMQRHARHIPRTGGIG